MGENDNWQFLQSGLLERHYQYFILKKGPYLLYMAFVLRGIYFSCFFLCLCSFILPTPMFGIFNKVLVKVSQDRSGVYLSNQMPESIHIWTTMSKVTLEDWYLHHDSRPQKPDPWMLLVKSLDVFKCTTKLWLKFFKWCISQ